MPLAPFVPAHAELSDETILGAAVRTRPAYDGSASQRTDAVPLVRYYGDHWFVRDTQDYLEAGLRAEPAPGLHLGAQLAYETGRKSNESSFLQAHAMPDVDRGATYGVYLDWDVLIAELVPSCLVLRWRQDFDPHLGGQGDVRWNFGILREGPLAMAAVIETTWANAQSTNAFYGVTPAQSAIGGLPADRVGGGWLSSLVGLGWRLELSRHWLALGGLEFHRLQGGAAASPLAERTHSTYAVLGIAWAP